MSRMRACSSMIGLAAIASAAISCPAVSAAKEAYGDPEADKAPPEEYAPGERQRPCPRPTKAKVDQEDRKAKRKAAKAARRRNRR